MSSLLNLHVWLGSQDFFFHYICYKHPPLYFLLNTCIGKNKFTHFLFYKIIIIYLLNLLIFSNKLPRVFKHYEKLHPFSINRQDGTRVLCRVRVKGGGDIRVQRILLDMWLDRQIRYFPKGRALVLPTVLCLLYYIHIKSIIANFVIIWFVMKLGIDQKD